LDFGGGNFIGDTIGPGDLQGVQIVHDLATAFGEADQFGALVIGIDGVFDDAVFFERVGQALNVLPGEAHVAGDLCDR
jgi:hypothetical protein